MTDLRTAVGDVLGEFADSWKRNDGAAVGELFTEDGSLVNPFGQRADGRAAVAAMYTEFFAGMLGGTSTTFSARRVRPIGEDHAFLDCDQVISGGAFELNGHLSALLRAEAGQWRIVDGRPHAYLDPAA
jgi:uncharacterized protein (TIGR02246 family)